LFDVLDSNFNACLRRTSPGLSSTTSAPHDLLLQDPSVRIDGFKLEGGEWFKEGFRKLLSQE